MQTDVITLSPQALPRLLPEWYWRTSNGLTIRPMVMPTRHLHHTLVMIWHHSMPDAARLRPYYRRYSFDPNFYTPTYMRQAVAIMLPELIARDDRTSHMDYELNMMIRYLNGNPAALQPPIRALTYEKGEAQ
jgi:hypothetical protein